ncbi:amidase family protein [Rhodococcus opacus]|nr:amidase family protein [Rhodococcus opacus]UNN04273.1 amidase family protein [Rhodococcus opacus]
MLGACGERLHDPEVPPLPDGLSVPGGGAVSEFAPVDKATWRVQGDPLVAPTGDGPLAGKRLAVTDLYAVAGQQIGAGSGRRLAEAPVETGTAAVVARLLGQGARVVGLAQTDDLGYGHSGINQQFGTPPNPRAEDCLPGGATSGAASAVAQGSADIGLGVDTTGSVRIPASYQGLYGFAPSRGAVSTDGLFPLSHVRHPRVGLRRPRHPRRGLRRASPAHGGDPVPQRAHLRRHQRRRRGGGARRCAAGPHRVGEEFPPPADVDRHGHRPASRLVRRRRRRAGLRGVAAARRLGERGDDVARRRTRPQFRRREPHLGIHVRPETDQARRGVADDHRVRGRQPAPAARDLLHGPRADELPQR